MHNQKQRSGVQKKSTVTDYYVYCAYCVSLGLGSFFIFHSFSLPISEITQNSCLHGNLILQFSRRITFFLQHMGAKRIEIDVEVKAIFLKKNPLGYDEDSDNGGILVPQTLQFQSGIWVFKKNILICIN